MLCQKVLTSVNQIVYVIRGGCSERASTPKSDLKMSGAYAEKISLSSAISASENEADEGDGPNKGGSMGYQQVGSLTQENHSCRLRSGH